MGAFRNAAKNKLTAQLLAPTAARGGVITQLQLTPHTSSQQGWEPQEEEEEQVEEESKRKRMWIRRRRRRR